MHQLIPEHPASYAADGAILALLILTAVLMVVVW